MSGHTPGPWIAEDEKGAGWQIKAKIAEIGDDFLTTHFHAPSIRDVTFHCSPDGSVTVLLAYERWMQFPSGDWREMTEANARLIAAAPELLEACRKFVTVYRKSQQLEKCDTAVWAAEAAIAKATEGS